MISQGASSETEREELEEWTLAAARAAEQGQWDRVEACYQKRETVMRRVVLTQEQIARVLAIDGRIQAKVIAAREAVAEQLRRSFAARLTLKGLRSGIGEPGPGDGSGALLMKA